MKPLKRQHPRSARPDPGEAEGTSGSPKSSPFFSPAPGLAWAPLPGPARPGRGCCCRAHTHALCNFLSLREDRRPPMQKRISKRKSNNPRKKAWVCFASRDFSPQQVSAKVCPRVPFSARGDRRLREQGAGTDASSILSRKSQRESLWIQTEGTVLYTFLYMIWKA